MTFDERVEAVKEACTQAGHMVFGAACYECLGEAIRAAVAEEREACAQEADRVVDPVTSPLTAVSSNAGRLIAALIRRRA
jgi:hypothetical protein